MDNRRQHFMRSLNVLRDVHICTFGPFWPGTWKNETTGEQSTQLLDLVYRTGKHKTVHETLDAAYELNRELSPKITISQGYGMGL